MQETYNDACSQISDAQKVINVLVTSTTPEDVRDHAEIAGQRTNALKIKDSAIKIKLELAKLQNDILKTSTDTVKQVTEPSTSTASVKDFDAIRDMIRKAKEPTIDTTYKLD